MFLLNNNNNQTTRTTTATINWTKFFLILLFLLDATTTPTNGKVVKKNQKELLSSTGKTPITTTNEKRLLKKQQQPAIIAIEIIDPKDNQTGDAGAGGAGGKGRKRTINSSLGYGYHQNYFNVQPKAPKYEYYKYSQHDLPPIKGGLHHNPLQSTAQHHYQEHQPHNFEIQKSIQYDLGTTTHHQHQHQQQGNNLQQYYQPGTTLYSSIDQHGHVGGLTKQLPLSPAHHSGDGNGMVPVIIFRVYTNQLSELDGNNELHANIPQHHPYAALNSINLNQLLNQYVQRHLLHQQHQQQQQQQHSSSSGSELETHENYPDDAHTKVIFHKTPSQQAAQPSPHQQSTGGGGKKFKISVPPNVFSKVEIQEHEYDDTPHYTNVQPDDQPNTQHYQQPISHTPPNQAYLLYHQNQVQNQPNYQYHHQPDPQYQHDQPEQQSNYQYYHQQNQINYANQYEDQPNQQYYYYQQQQQQQQKQQSADYDQYNQPTYYQQEEQQPQQQNDEVDYNDSPLHPEQIAENHNRELHKVASDVGRDLHPKVYNYHAHQTRDTSTSTTKTSTQTQAKRSSNKKQRRRRVKATPPLVLAPNVRDSLEEV